MRVSLSRKFVDTGPMIFVKRLFKKLTANHGVVIVDRKPDIYFAIIDFQNRPKGSKVVLRIDGMYWNTKDTNVDRGNRNIFSSIKKADGIIYQSQFCKNCYESHLGKTLKPHTVILNGVDWDIIDSTKSVDLPKNPGLVASAEWRPTKRAKSICKGFLASNIPHQLYMIGKPPPNAIQHDRITWLGQVKPGRGIGIMKSCSHAIHLGKFDPCPNSVVEEICCGLPVLHTANGGTPEIVRENGVRLLEDERWDYRPIHGVNNIDPAVTARGLEQLVVMDRTDPHDDLNINNVAQIYYDFFLKVLQ